MKPIHGVMTALLLCAQMLLPAGASAQAGDRGNQSVRRSRFDFPPPIVADAVQSSAAKQRPSVGRRLLRNTLIGAAIGGTLAGLMAGGDCGNCGSDRAKVIASGAMYGALIGAAINSHPSWRPSPSHRGMTMAPRSRLVAPSILRWNEATRMEPLRRE